MTNDNANSQAEMPEEYSRRQLNALYREIPLKDTTSRLLRKYLNAMANLYGIVPVSKAYEIISEQNPRLVSKDEFLAFAEVARHECEDYYLLGLDELYFDGPTTPLWKREIIDVSLVGENLDDYHALMKSQGGKPYYIPKKTQLLAFDNSVYCEETTGVLAFRQFLKEEMHLSSVQEDEIFNELVFAVRCRGAGVQQVMERINELEITFAEEEDFSTFAALFQEFHNNTRMQCNRGFTPDEMFSMQLPEERMPKSLSFGPNIRKGLLDGTMDADELRKNILNMEMPSEELRFNLLKELADAAGSNQPAKKPAKIGRNELCPCGSGKKYKKCCGR